jgi:polar amino acid transport system permease protein
MNYVFQFGVVTDHARTLLDGALVTLAMSLAALVLGLAIGIVCAYLQMSRRAWVRIVVRAYVEYVRNTPFLVQLFFLYFALLPWLGWRIDAWIAALAGMALNFGAYATEIVRGGLDAVPRGQIEAGRSLGLGRLQIFRLIILPQALDVAFPALASQFVLLVLGSSVVSAISVEELTGVVASLQSTTFRAFEFYFAIAAIYLAMAIVLRSLLARIHRHFVRCGARA